MFKTITITNEWNETTNHEVYVEGNYALRAIKSNRTAYIYKLDKIAGVWVKQEKVNLTTLKRGLKSGLYSIR